MYLFLKVILHQRSGFLFVFLSVLLVYVASGYVRCPSLLCDLLTFYSVFLFLYFLALIGDDLP